MLLSIFTYEIICFFKIKASTLIAIQLILYNTKLLYIGEYAHTDVYNTCDDITAGMIIMCMCI